MCDRFQSINTDKIVWDLTSLLEQKVIHHTVVAITNSANGLDKQWYPEHIYLLTVAGEACSMSWIPRARLH